MIRMTLNQDIIDLPYIMNRFFICSKNLFLVKSVINEDPSASDEIVGDVLNDINTIINASKKIKFEQRPYDSNLLIQTSQSDQYVSPKDIDINMSMSEVDTERLIDIFSNISKKMFEKIDVSDINYAQELLNKLYRDIDVMDLD